MDRMDELAINWLAVVAAAANSVLAMGTVLGSWR